MPVHNGMGQSDKTLEKERQLRLLLEQHISTVKTIWAQPYARKYPKCYYYVDLTAGSGHNELIDCDGSPIIFERAARRAGISYRAHFIDQDEANTLSLRALFGANPRIAIHTGDHAEIAPAIVRGWPEYDAYGLIYADLNGVPPFDVFSELSQDPRLAKVDFLIRCYGTAVKRAGRRLLPELGTIQKKFWIVCDLDQHDKCQWTFLMGLNWKDLNVMHNHGFYYTYSKTGQDILKQLHHTKPELEAAEQLELPYLTYEEYLRHPSTEPSGR